ncbi:MAG TPA: hypothetical protein VK037_05070 [Pseudogracilibacillus sp.]|nr:hypothetical protein [Pseudogracilibacillus sp.]
MKLFLRKYLFLIILQLLQWSALFLLFWLGGFRDISLLLYSLMVVLFFLLLFLSYKYYTQRKLYKHLSEGISSIDEVYQELDYSPLSKAIEQMMVRQHKLYDLELVQLKEKQLEQFIFIDRWIH